MQEIREKHTATLILIAAIVVAGCATRHPHTPTMSWHGGVPSPRFSFSGVSSNGTTRYLFEYESSHNHWEPFSLPDNPPTGFTLAPQSEPATFVLHHSRIQPPVVFTFIPAQGAFRVTDPDMEVYWLTDN